MIRSFENAGTAAVYNGENTRAARQICPASLWRVAARKLDQLDSIASLEKLRVPPGNRLERLSGDRRGQHSIRINTGFASYGQNSGQIELRLATTIESV